MTSKAIDLPVKYARPKTDQTQGVTIFEVPAAGLFQVLGSWHGDMVVQTLVPTGWITLISLKAGEVRNATEALQLWLDIQTPVTAETPAADGQSVGMTSSDAPA